MTILGYIGLGLAFAACIAGIVTALASVVLGRTASAASQKAGMFRRIALYCSYVAAAALVLCCVLIVVCFFSGDNSIAYVVEYRSDSTSSLAWLFVLSGLWSGRQGSLLFWAMLIALFASYMSFKVRREDTVLDSWAFIVVYAVLLAFLGVLLFSSSNMPFLPLDAEYLDESGNLTGGAESWGLNPLLEHWAMAIHPPTLFIGYAGLTIPFAYGLGTFIAGNDSDEWVRRVNGVTSFSWLFLGLGIGLGAVWAYVVLGWGGYWGWDPVENASLLSWLCALALMHSFTIYRQRGSFKRWSVVAACLTFMFVIVGTFISRSGLVQSVHAFEGDNVSLVLFATLIGCAFVAALAAALLRRNSFAVEAQEEDEGAFLSRSMAYYVNNVVMIVGSFALAYMTVSSALPDFLPLGGETLGSETYDAIARPLGVLLFLVAALCPLLGWMKTDRKTFWREARLPLVCALVLFALLAVYWWFTLVPAYNATIDAGGTTATDLAAEGPSWYYNGLALVAFLVASLLVFNSLFALVRLVKPLARAKTGAKLSAFTKRGTHIGGLVAHLGMGIMLIGLVGSAMYVTESSVYLGEEGSDSAESQATVQGYTLALEDTFDYEQEGDGLFYGLNLAVTTEGGQSIGVISPTMQIDPNTMQRFLRASVTTFPLEDLFVVYNGINTSDDQSITVHINRLILFVWAGFALLMVGTLLALLSHRGYRRGIADAQEPVACTPDASDIQEDEGKPEEQPEEQSQVGVHA